MTTLGETSHEVKVFASLLASHIHLKGNLASARRWRIHLSNLKALRAALQSFEKELDKLIREAEEVLEYHAQLDAEVEKFSTIVSNRAK